MGTSRSSVAPVLAEWRSEDRDAFLAVGEVTDTVQNLSERLNTYAAQLPRQVRWQAELLVEELAEEHDLPGLLGGAGQAVRRLLAEEHRAVLEDVNGQRQQAFEYLTAERVAALAALRQERIEALMAVETLQIGAVDSAMVRLRSLVDYALWRLAVLLTVLMLSAATLTGAAVSTTVGRLFATNVPRSSDFSQPSAPRASSAELTSTAGRRPAPRPTARTKATLISANPTSAATQPSKKRDRKKVPRAART